MMTHRITALGIALLLSLPVLAADVRDGSPAPGFMLQTRGGGTLSLDQLKGQVVLLNFWASWCGPCRQEMPLLEGIYKKYHKLGVTLVGVNVEPDAKAANAALEKTPVSFPILYDPDSKVSQLYNVASMPSTVIIDRSGKVRLLHHGYKPGDENEYIDSLRALIKD
jgi:peroxiredoxin